MLVHSVAGNIPGTYSPLMDVLLLSISRAEEFGGGHELAAGCTIQATPEKAEKLLLEVIEEICGDKL